MNMTKQQSNVSELSIRKAIEESGKSVVIGQHGNILTIDMSIIIRRNLELHPTISNCYLGLADMSDKTNEFLIEFKELLEKHDASMGFSCDSCSDTHGITGDHIYISTGNKTHKYDGWSINGKDVIYPDSTYVAPIFESQREETVFRYIKSRGRLLHTAEHLNKKFRKIDISELRSILHGMCLKKYLFKDETDVMYKYGIHADHTEGY